MVMAGVYVRAHAVKLVWQETVVCPQLFRSLDAGRLMGGTFNSLSPRKGLIVLTTCADMRVANLHVDAVQMSNRFGK